ncbi:MAG: carboxylating nicotinate-nucleotide diphosphorylase [Alphaproteobacteria bacterium]|nr:carboxylating nicotinate-nucleotide diphosphorylase [Alphaproteobacteria bacterium]
MQDLIGLPTHLISTAVEDALSEDLGRAGDITSAYTIPANAVLCATINSRQTGCIAGVDFAIEAFKKMDPHAEVTVFKQDGHTVAPGDKVLQVHGNARSILSAERVALNFMGHMSGIASATRNMVDKIAGTNARVTCTRKTTPGLRAIEKYAVRAGGGYNHRFGLDDAILIKDNHIAVAGNITETLLRVKAQVSHMTRIEIEVDNLDQLREVMSVGVDVVMLDNMAPDMLRKALEIVDGRAVTEASGNVKIDTIRAIAETGVDVISVGWLTHSAPCLDLGLDYS